MYVKETPWQTMVKDQLTTDSITMLYFKEIML